MINCHHVEKTEGQETMETYDNKRHDVLWNSGYLDETIHSDAPLVDSSQAPLCKFFVIQNLDTCE